MSDVTLIGRALLLSAFALLFASSPAWPQTTAIQDVPLTREQRIENLDKSIKQIGEAVDAEKAKPDKQPRDLRGLTLLDYIERWAFTPATMKELPELLAKSRASAAGDVAALDRADELIYVAASRVAELQEYWNGVPIISWRDRWTAFARANQLDPDVIDPLVSSQEKTLIDSLDAGSFFVARRHSENLDDSLDIVIDRSGTEILKNRKAADIVFVPRKTPCVAADGSAGAAKARIVESGDPDALYPADAKTRGEHGVIIVRARIDAKSCATANAVVVSSGYPLLDAAAIAVAEASRYQAAVAKGKPVASELTFKVRFNLK
jgi:TonB family protein